MTMDSLGTNPQLTAEFVKFLNAQLQDCRDQLQRLNEVRLAAGMLVTRARRYECSNHGKHRRISRPQKDIKILKQTITVTNPLSPYKEIFDSYHLLQVPGPI